MNIKKDEKKQFRKNEGDVAGSVSQSSHKSSHKGLSIIMTQKGNLSSKIKIFHFEK